MHGSLLLWFHAISTLYFQFQFNSSLFMRIFRCCCCISTCNHSTASSAKLKLNCASNCGPCLSQLTSKSVWLQRVFCWLMMYQSVCQCCSNKRTRISQFDSDRFADRNHSFSVNAHFAYVPYVEQMTRLGGSFAVVVAWFLNTIRSNRFSKCEGEHKQAGRSVVALHHSMDKPTHVLASNAWSKSVICIKMAVH